jgi:hypothetical protein
MVGDEEVLPNVKELSRGQDEKASVLERCASSFVEFADFSFAPCNPGFRTVQEERMNIPMPENRWTQCGARLRAFPNAAHAPRFGGGVTRRLPEVRKRRELILVHLLSCCVRLRDRPVVGLVVVVGPAECRRSRVVVSLVGRGASRQDRGRRSRAARPCVLPIQSQTGTVRHCDSGPDPQTPATKSRFAGRFPA